VPASSFSCCTDRRERRPGLPVCRRPDRSRSTFRKTACCAKRAYWPVNRPLPAKSRTTNLGPFGEVIRTSGATAAASPFGFSTKYTDMESGLLNFGYRSYNSSAGRWLSRDPIGELGFRLVLAGRQPFVDASSDDFSQRLNQLLKEPGGPNHYGFVGNDSLDHIDPLGLLKFDGCSSDQQTKLQADFKDYCGKLKSSLTDCCKNRTIPPKLQNMCDNSQNITIKCEAASTGKCDKSCGWSMPGGQTLHFCPSGWGQGCGPLGCTLMHEMTHMIGHGGEKWPQQVEKCFGCP